MPFWAGFTTLGVINTPRGCLGSSQPWRCTPGRCYCWGYWEASVLDSQCYVLPWYPLLVLCSLGWSTRQPSPAGHSWWAQGVINIVLSIIGQLFLQLGSHRPSYLCWCLLVIHMCVLEHLSDVHIFCAPGVVAPLARGNWLSLFWRYSYLQL